MIAPIQQPENSSTANDLALVQASSGASRRRIERSLAIAALAAMFLLLAALAVGCKKKSPSSNSSDTSATPSTPASASTQPSSSAPISGKDQPGSLADRLAAVQAGPPESQPAKVILPDWKPVTSSTSPVTIPLVSGLVLTGVISFKYGDLESIRTVTDVNPKTVTMTLAGDTIVKLPPPGSSDPPVTKRVSGTRLMDVPDLASAHHLLHMFAIGKTEHFPGSTALTASTEVLNQLRAGQTVPFDFQNDVVDMLTQSLTGHATVSEALIYWNGHSMYKCPLQRIEPTDLAIPVLVNGVRVELPAVHARCDLSSEEQAHFYILDQPSNPILLATQVGPFDARSQIIKITFPLPGAVPASSGAAPASSMEKDLAAKKPVEIYGIYFDFASAEIKPESEAVLKQIAAILQHNPDWKLSVSGHTDNVGDPNFNLALSQRRAVAVKNALVTRYKISPDRLVTNGYGASQPIDSNTTMEGRARNRRVELQRQ
jgi:outer membrane protein OmpA-like peptidoglycan-associated protein